MKLKRNKIRDIINSNISSYPFLASYWSIFVDDNDSEFKIAEFGFYETNSNFPIPFYKPISRILNFKNLENG